jgi:hypothetical protein
LREQFTISFQNEASKTDDLDPLQVDGLRQRAATIFEESDYLIIEE